MIKAASTVHFVGCGTAAHAARCGEYLFRASPRRQANCVVGSEFGYLADFLDERSLVVGLSQSGETIDLLESMKAAATPRRAARRRWSTSRARACTAWSTSRSCSRPGPSGACWRPRASPPSWACCCMAAYAAHGRVDEGRALLERAADEIRGVPDRRPRRTRCAALAERVRRQRTLYVIGRGPSYPMALEAALKIKEVSYIHAEGFAGGELKHGVIALIERARRAWCWRRTTRRSAPSSRAPRRSRPAAATSSASRPAPSDVWDEHIPVADVGEARLDRQRRAAAGAGLRAGPAAAAWTPTSRATWPRASP